MIKMKKRIIVHTGNLSIGGQEKMTIEFLKVLPRENYDIKLIVEEDKGEENYYAKEIPNDINYEFLVSNKFMQSLIKQKKSKNIFNKVLYSINLTRKKNKAIKKMGGGGVEDIDLIIDYNMGLLRNLHKLKKKCPVVGWCHLGNGEKQKSRQKEENMMLYDFIITINNEMKEGFEKNYGKKGIKIEKIVNFLDDNLVRKRAEVEINENFGEYLVSVGALTERKNHKELINGFNNYLKNNETALNLVIIGEGKERINLENQIKKLRLEKRVFLLGRRENPYPYIKNSKLFVLPSHFEGFPVVLMEAMILGKMVVAKSNGATREVLNSKMDSYGILVENIEETLQYVIKEQLEIDSNRKKWEEKSLLRSKEFSQEKAKIKINNLIEKILR